MCKAFTSSNRVLPPWGDTESKYMMIGQSLCTQCYEGGEPFYGHSGNLLDHVFDLLKIRKSSFLITNVVLHNPPGNRASLPEERLSCSETHGRKVFSLQEPRLVVSLGRDAYSFISRTTYSVRRCLEPKVWSKSNLADGTSTRRFVWIPEVHPAFYYRSSDERMRRDYVQRLVQKLRLGIRLVKEGRINE